MCLLRFKNNLLTIEGDIGENTVIEAFVRFRFAITSLPPQRREGEGER
jgi:hypothetical protein